jgi:hypothetical protein
VAHGYDGAKILYGRKRHLLGDTTGLLLRVLVPAAGLRDAGMAPWRLPAAYESCELLQASHQALAFDVLPISKAPTSHPPLTLPTGRDILQPTRACLVSPEFN